MTQRTYALSELAQALEYIPADDRENWVRMGMALHSEYPGTDGRELFMQWSASAPNFSKTGARDTWKSFKPGGRVRIGTLIAQAKAQGWRPGQSEGALAPSPEERRAHMQAREQALAQQAAATEAAQTAAAAKACQLWEQAAEHGESGYLARKGVGAHGVRFAAGGRVLVPMRDHDGALWNLQTIGPDGQKAIPQGWPQGRALALDGCA
jgi:putative DNA primase/helicase